MPNGDFDKVAILSLHYTFYTFLKENTHAKSHFGMGVLLWKGTKCTVQRQYSNFTEIALWHGCPPVNLLHISEQLFLRTPPQGCFCT